MEESTHYMTAKQLNSAKILRLAALAQDDSLFLALLPWAICSFLP